MTKNKSSILTSLGINVGTRTHHTETIAEADIIRFAEAFRDFNPVHISSDFAKKTLFGGELLMECWSRD